MKFSKWRLLQPIQSIIDCVYGPHDRAPDDIVCGNPCLNPSTIFVAMFPCDVWTNDSLKEFIAPKCLMLLHDCVVGTTWTARWRLRRFSSGEAFWWQPTLNETPLARSTYTDDCRKPGDSVISPTVGGIPGREWGAWEDQGLVTALMDHEQWKLETFPDVTPPGGGIYATLSLNSITGATALYETEDLQCAGSGMEITFFEKVSTSSQVSHLPCRIPVMARNAIEHPLACATKSDQCNCNDSGDETQSFDIAWSGGCDGIEWPDRLPNLLRQTPEEVGLTYPGISIDGSPCGVFVYVFDTGTCGKEAAAVIYCDGTGYSVDFYCYDGNPESPTYQEWVSQGPLGSLVYTKGCLLPHLAGTVPALTCCCPQGCVEECCPDMPSLLAFEIDSGCTTLNTGELERVGSTQTWEKNGSGTVGGSAHLNCVEGCYYWTQEISGCVNSGTDYIQVLNVLATEVSCDPFFAEFNFTTHEGQAVTVTVTE